jgi:hypothetical protein
MISMRRVFVRSSLFLSMVTLSLLVGITGFALYSWELKGRAILFGLDKSGWANLHLFIAVALTVVLFLHLVENRRVIPVYIRTVVGRV